MQMANNHDYEVIPVSKVVGMMSAYSCGAEWIYKNNTIALTNVTIGVFGGDTQPWM